jgi:hypothetical protein
VQGKVAAPDNGMAMLALLLLFGAGRFMEGAVGAADTHSAGCAWNQLCGAFALMLFPLVLRPDVRAKAAEDEPLIATRFVRGEIMRCDLGLAPFTCNQPFRAFLGLMDWKLKQREGRVTKLAGSAALQAHREMLRQFGPRPDFSTVPANRRTIRAVADDGFRIALQCRRNELPLFLRQLGERREHRIRILRALVHDELLGLQQRRTPSAAASKLRARVVLMHSKLVLEDRTRALVALHQLVVTTRPMLR